MFHSDALQREAIAKTLSSVEAMGTYADPRDVIRSGGSIAVSFMREHTMFSCHALSTIVRLQVAFEDVEKASEEILDDLRRAYDNWQGWLDENAPIVDQVMKTLARYRSEARGRTNYEELIAGITAVEISLMSAHNARVDVVIFLKTLIDRLDPQGAKIVGEANSPQEVSSFFASLAAA